MHYAILKVLHSFKEKKSPQGKRYAIFPSKCSKWLFWDLKFFLKNNMKFTRAAYWINSKNKQQRPLLWCNYWRSSMLWNSTSWSSLKLNVQIQLALHPCDPFLLSNRNMTGKCWKIMFCCVERDSKRFDFKTGYILLSPWTLLLIRLVLLEIFAYPSNKRVIYGPELNL